jgi:hypothetical protein
VSTVNLTGSTGTYPCVSARLLMPWRGVWVADLELALSAAQLLTPPSSGKVTITIVPGTPGAPPLATLVGTIDPRGTGVFAQLYRVRVLAGGGGWEQPVTPQHYHSDGGLFGAQVFGATAISVGEAVVTPIPVSLGNDFMRTAGPASRVLEGLDWYVDPATGTTMVGNRLPAVADASLEILTWDPAGQVAELVCEALVLPGTPLVDPRLPQGATTRDVEQLFDAAGSHVKAWCSTASVAQLTNDLRSLIQEFSGRKFLATYLYRIVLQDADGRLELQAVDTAAGIPDTLPLSPWTGVSGASVKYKLGSQVRVAFFEGAASQPIVDSYDPTSIPLQATYDATAAVNVGPSAATVALAGGAAPVATGPWATQLMAALDALAMALSALTTPPLSPVGAAGAAFQTALGALPSPTTTKVQAT